MLFAPRPRQIPFGLELAAETLDIPIPPCENSGVVIPHQTATAPDGRLNTEKDHLPQMTMTEDTQVHSVISVYRRLT